MSLGLGIEDAPFSIYGSNIPNVASIGSTETLAKVLVYAADNSNNGYSFGVSNIDGGVFLIGQDTPTVVIKQDRVGIGTYFPQATLQLDGNAIISQGIGCNLPAINPSAYPSYFIHELTSGTSLVSGAQLYGDSRYDNVNGYIELTSNVNARNGQVFWQLNPGNSFAFDFELYTGGGTGADGTAAIFFSTIGNSGTEDGTGSGYAVSFNETFSTVWLIYDTTVLATASVPNIASSKWEQVRINYILGTIIVQLNGKELIRHTDVTQRSVLYEPNTYIGFAARNGALNNYHRIRKVRVHRIQENLWRFAGSNLATDIVYEYGNVGIGLGSNLPEAQLHVGSGGLQVDGNIQANGHIIPGGSNDYDLGSIDHAWRDLYLSGNSIYIGGVKISASTQGVVFDSPIITSAVVDQNGKPITGDQNWLLDQSSNAILSSNVNSLGIGTQTPLAFTHIQKPLALSNIDTLRISTSSNAPSFVVNDSGCVGIGTANPTSKLQVDGNVQIGSGSKGEGDTFTGGPFFKQSSWGEAGSNHTLAYADFSTGDNSAGTLHIQVSNKRVDSQSKIGTVMLSYLKRTTQGTSIAIISRHLSVTIDEFDIVVSNNDINITSDSDCAISWTSIGSC